MTVEFAMSAVIGFVQGYLWCTFVLGSNAPLTRRVMQDLGEGLPFCRFLTSVMILLFAIFSYFGLGQVWIDLLAIPNEGSQAELFRAWYVATFAGFSCYCIIPRIEKAIRSSKVLKRLSRWRKQNKPRQKRTK